MKWFVLAALGCATLFGTGFVVGKAEVSEVINQCQSPMASFDPSAQETYLAGELDRWHKAYEKMEDQWLTCTRDLARISEEQNADIICSAGVCEAR